MFGLPFQVTNIEKNLYDRDKILEDILYNYQIDSQRDNWDTSSLNTSNFHHSNLDDSNPKFKKIDYSSLKPVYDNHVRSFFKNVLKCIKPIELTLEVVNYTCSCAGQYMRQHIHTKADFVGVHFLKFNPNKHKPTVFVNPYIWGSFVNNFFTPDYVASFESGSATAYMSEYWTLNTLEDNFVITPGILPHFVPPSESEEHRITIVTNICVKK